MARTGVLPKSPLVLAVASVRFAPWTMLQKNIDEVTEELRELFPLVQPLSIQQEVGQGYPMFDTIPIWILTNSDKSCAVQLSQGQILVTSLRYVNFSEFSSLVLKVVSAVFSRMRFIDCSSMGIRYVDHICPLANEKLEKYVHQGLLAPIFTSFERLGGNSIAFYRDGESQLRVRCISQPGFMSIPEDLIPIRAMMLTPGKVLQVQVLEEEQCVVDMDALIEYPSPMRITDLSEISNKLSSLHDIANRYFRHPNVFTDHAFNVWGGE